MSGATPVRIGTVDLSVHDLALLEALRRAEEPIASHALAEEVGQPRNVVATRLGVFKRLGLVDHDRRAWQLTATARTGTPWQA